MHFVVFAPPEKHVRIAERIGGQPTLEQTTEIKRCLKDIGALIDELAAEETLLPRASAPSEGGLSEASVAITVREL